jgi:hypothetical protein
MDSGTTIGPINYTAADTEGQPMTATVTSSNTDLINASGINATFSGGSGSIRLTSVNGMIGTVDIIVSVSDGERHTEKKFTVTVYPNIQIGGNIVRNGDGSSLAGWVDENNRFSFGSQFSLGDLPDGLNNYTMYQDIDVTRFSSYIDTGLAQYTTSFTKSSSATFQIQGFGSSIYDEKFIASSNSTTPYPGGLIPAGTRKIRVAVGGSDFATIGSIVVTIANLSKMTDITDQMVKAGELCNYTFDVIYPEGAALSATSTNNALFVNNTIAILGTGNQRTLSFTPKGGTQGSATITVKAGTTTLDTFTVTIYSVPGAPTITSVTDASNGMTISFDPPASNGGESIDEYVVTSSPGAITARGSSSPITVTGLTVGTSYTFSRWSYRKHQLYHW